MKSINTFSVFLRIILSGFILNLTVLQSFRGSNFWDIAQLSQCVRSFSGLRRSPLAFAFQAQANQIFRAGGSSGTSCPSGSQYRGSGFCRATKPNYQFFRAGGRNVLPQRIAIQGQWLLPSTLMRAGIHPQQNWRAGTTTDFMAKLMRL